MCLLQTKEDVTSATQWTGDYDPDYASWLPPSGMYLCYALIYVLLIALGADTYRIRKNIGEELNLANQNKIANFYLANIFCTCLTQNVARDPSA